MKDSPAAKAGLKAGDVIVEYDGHAVAKSSDLPQLVAATPIGRNVPVRVMRDGSAVTLTAQIAELSQSQQLAVAGSGRGKLGLSVEPLTPEVAHQLGVKDRTGVAVTGVQPGSPADVAGIQPGDVIVQVDRRPVNTLADLRQILAEQKTGKPTLFLIHRQDASLFVAIEVGESPQG